MPLRKECTSLLNIIYQGSSVQPLHYGVANTSQRNHRETVVILLYGGYTYLILRRNLVFDTDEHLTRARGSSSKDSPAVRLSRFSVLSGKITLWQSNKICCKMQKAAKHDFNSITLQCMVQVAVWSSISLALKSLPFPSHACKSVAYVLLTF